jgi:hypothetical protein
MEHDEPVPGLLTGRQLTQLFELHREDSSKWDSKALADKFAVEEATVEKLLAYVRSPYWEQQGGMKVGYWAKPTPGVPASAAELFLRKK